MSYENPRLKLDDNILQAFINFSDGNPGAISVLTQGYKHGPEIDPDSAFGGLGIFIGLDNLDVYGSEIWMFYKDVCGENIAKVLGVLRAIQMGFVSNAKVKNAIAGNESLDVNDLLEKVKETLPNFDVDFVK